MAQAETALKLYAQNPQDARVFFNNARAIGGLKRFLSSTQGEERIKLLVARYLNHIAATKKDSQTEIDTEFQEIRYETARLKLPASLVDDAAQAIVSAYLNKGEDLGALRFLHTCLRKSYLADAGSVATPDAMEALARRVIRNKTPYLYHEYRSIFEKLCPDALTDLDNDYTNACKGRKETLFSEIRYDLARGMNKAAQGKLVQLTRYGTDRTAIDEILRDSLALLCASGDYEKAFEFITTDGFERFSSNRFSYFSGDDVKAIASHFVAKGDLKNYKELRALLASAVPDLHESVADLYEQSRTRELSALFDSAYDRFLGGNAGQGWTRLRTAKHKLDATDTEMQGMAERILDGFIEHSQYDRALLFLQSPEYLRNIRKSGLNACHVHEMADSFRAYGMPAALQALRAHIRDHGLDIDWPEKIAAPSDSDVLATFAPVVVDVRSTHALARTLLTTKHADIADLQARALEPVWQALEIADAHTPAFRTDERETPFVAGDLRGIFRNVARYMNVLQFQLPMIAPLSHNTGNLIKNACRDLGHEGALEAGIFGGSNSFGASKVCYSLGKTHDTQFTFVVIVKPESRNACGEVLEEKRLYSLPLIRLDDEILKATLDFGGIGMLRHFQQLEAIKNHDWFHHVTARNLNPYFGHSPTQLTEDEQPYARILGAPQQQKIWVSRNETVMTYGTEKTIGDFVRKYGSPGFYGSVPKPELDVFGNTPYEFHGMHIQRALYQGYLHDGPEGRRAEGHINGYFDGLEKLAARMSGRAGDPGPELVRMYYATLIYNSLLYVVPHSHPLMRLCEDRVDGLGMSRTYLEYNVNARIHRRNEASRFLINQESGLSCDNVAGMTAAEIVRWNAYALANNFMVRLHKKNPETEAAHAVALPALRSHLTHVRADFETIALRGGMDAHDLMEAKKKRANRAKFSHHAPKAA